MNGMRRSEGFTLLEMIIAMAILAIVSTQMFMVLTTQKDTYMTNERALEAQEDARLVVELIGADVRLAGYMVPREAGVSSVDGGTAAGDRLCVSDWTVISNAVLPNASSHFDFGRISASGSAVTGTTIDLASAAELNVDGDAANANDFSVNAGVIISNGTSSHCGMIQAVNAATGRITLTAATAMTGAMAATLSASSGGVRVTPAVIYAIDVSGLGLRRNNVMVSADVEDLEVEFGVDVNLDSTITAPAEFPIHVLAGFDAALIRAVRISIVARSAQPDLKYQGGTRRFPGTANRLTGPNDTFLRRRFVTSVLPRNLL